MSIVFPQLLREYKPDDIYNADETGLYYRATPDGSLCYPYQQLSGSKKAMDRVTILCCANMSSNDKVKLLVIGKSKKPRCFKDIDMDTLPISYRANKNVWMTSLLFEEWITRWDSALGKQSRKILLLVGNCTAHPALDKLKNIRLEFLPPNTTSVIQPMDQGIIKNIKGHYRKELVQMTITAIEDNLLSTSCTATEVSAKITVLDAIRVVAKSWRQVKTQTIANCFRKGGFWVTASEEGTEKSLASQESNEEQALPEVVNGDSYLLIDEDMKCYNEDGTLEDDIVETLSNKRLCLEDGSDSDSDNDTVARISNVAAKRSIQVLQQYFVEQGFSDTLHASLDMCADEVFSNAASKMAQTTLDPFLA
ncbi:Tigger transposable element-derived protein 6-like [Oopsacas minuta]|uniref:Tigger transposable element-derived protein 6-like n=1 Tax=Oopsacas minuta TaxID=111878 RepID=A0AAV7JSG8_9METZ|nr:Tigger transposable element-derived protein 6-like [Oopsacas minuta]